MLMCSGIYILKGTLIALSKRLCSLSTFSLHFPLLLCLILVKKGQLHRYTRQIIILLRTQIVKGTHHTHFCTFEMTVFAPLLPATPSRQEVHTPTPAHAHTRPTAYTRPVATNASRSTLEG